MADTAQVTRYEQVKQILDRAAAGGATDYDGKACSGIYRCRNCCKSRSMAFA